MVCTYSQMANLGFWMDFNMFFEHFWNFQNFDQIWTPGPLSITKIIFKQKLDEIPNQFNERHFTHLNIWEIQNLVCGERTGHHFWRSPKNKLAIDALQKSQTDWYNNVLSECNNVDCIVDAMTERSAEIENMDGLRDR